MGKLARPNHNGAKEAASNYRRLLDERKQLSSKLAEVDARLHRLTRVHGSKSRPKDSEIEAWLDALSGDLAAIPPLPIDFSRADLYDDHD